MTVTLTIVCNFQPKIILWNVPNRWQWNVHITSNFVRIFVDVQSKLISTKSSFLIFRILNKTV